MNTCSLDRPRRVNWWMVVAALLLGLSARQAWVTVHYEAALRGRDAEITRLQKELLEDKEIMGRLADALENKEIARGQRY